MATMKQRKAAEALVETRGNVSEAMRRAGYTPQSAKNPKNLTESKGFHELLDEYGLTEQLIVTSLVSDIKSKPKKRKAELELAAKMRGMFVERLDLTSGGEALKPLVIDSSVAQRFMGAASQPTSDSQE